MVTYAVSLGRVPSNASLGRVLANASLGRVPSNASLGRVLSNASLGRVLSNVSLGRVLSNASVGRVPSNASLGLVPGAISGMVVGASLSASSVLCGALPSPLGLPTIWSGEPLMMVEKWTINICSVSREAYSGWIILITKSDIFFHFLNFLLYLVESSFRTDANDATRKFIDALVVYRPGLF